MSGILNILIVVLVVGWLIGFFAFQVGGLLHLLLGLALIALVLRLLPVNRK
ncbi:lmo0937 family membrane protein [Fluviicola taffensis]|uniref:Lmo0937 family membrane protein n=1 Tax=Fluviicola taffensis (strain DSM 16823 / NCIMB 13979 / RW262) TaxID=755732 RepID=F2IJZ6_FLUTR|nr:lmo0937 family membrane protein [Fluviicola taffensis]AEA45055.1 hypothetical protein Fluta_3079 [Fluviicola taffensis DSM 16823]